MNDSVNESKILDPILGSKPIRTRTASMPRNSSHKITDAIITGPANF